MSNLKVEDRDLYELLGVQFNADLSEIKKAYRKKALECHPDKNPDNPKAAEKFHELSKALEILTDDNARAAYNKVLNAKKAAKLRHRELDSKRQKLKDDLERREREADLQSKKYKTFDERSDEERLQAEILRLQKEGSKLLQEEQQRMSQQIWTEMQRLSGGFAAWDPTQYRIKIKWNAGDSTDNGGYNDENLRHILKKYGDINELLLSKDKKGSALVEFTDKEAADMAIELEKGFSENPLSLKLIKSKGTGSKAAAMNRSQDTCITESDYETLVMRRLRQAAERQKLIDEMSKDDE